MIQKLHPLKLPSILFATMIISCILLISSEDILAESTPPIPSPIDHFAGNEKAIVLSLTFFDNGAVVFDSAVVSLQPALGHAGEYPHLHAKVVDVKDNEIEEFNLWNPNLIRVYNSDGSHGEEIQSEITSPVIFSFHPDASFITLRNVSDDQKLITVDLKPIIREFCLNNPDDPDCSISDLAIESINAIDSPPLILLEESSDITIQTIITNKGPDAPTDGIFNQKTVNVSPGILVTPTEVVDQDEFSIDLREQRENDQIYNIKCLDPGVQSVTFTSNITPLSAAVIDPDESNNMGRHTLTVDCAVPVTVNIKPGFDTNPIILTDITEIPLAVLTTDKGEYGNPVAFDATTIDPLSARFGVKDLVIDDSGGSFTSHDKGLILDSKERTDEFTKDGDKDMEIHFKTAESGLEVGDTEACIKGKFVGENEEKFTFFGCDSVDIEKDISTDGEGGGGGCLIATAAYGSEMSPQVQILREIRDGKVMNTQSGASFMTGFNSLYYSFSPYIADYQRENPAFKEMVKIGITPMLSTLSMMSLADTESEIVGYGIGVILLNLGMYVAAPILLGMTVYKRIKSRINNQ